MDAALAKLRRKLIEHPWSTIHEWLTLRKLIKFVDVEVKVMHGCNMGDYDTRRFHIRRRSPLSENTHRIPSPDYEQSVRNTRPHESRDGVEICHFFLYAIWNVKHVRQMWEIQCCRCKKKTMMSYQRDTEGEIVQFLPGTWSWVNEDTCGDDAICEDFCMLPKMKERFGSNG